MTEGVDHQAYDESCYPTLDASVPLVAGTTSRLRAASSRPCSSHKCQRASDCALPGVGHVNPSHPQEQYPWCPCTPRTFTISSEL